ncbi:uncharacterized protein LOC118421507 [Branchiostoma floridae]|uniref:Uncharacterized protein LOC118421507 n=1 Tax=Branchiostoma floridae TaxID=7739 RepID=A0A9J7LKR8_BRAFL|nr:uncharacterized protein LOC118421507 [Branchiostoma floridae]
MATCEGGARTKIPQLDLANKSYEQFRFELLLWNKITNIPKKKRGIEILLSLPEGSKDEHKTREFLGSKLTEEELAAENSFQNVLDKMDEHLRRDNTGRLWEAFVAFDKYSRGPTTTISEYISTFDILYNKLNRAGDVTLPESVLGLLLVRRANLTLEEAKLVMTGVDYSKEDVSLFMQAKSSLRKFSDELVSTRSSHSGGIQQEIAHVTEAEVYQTSRGGGAKWSRGSGRGYSRQTGTARNRNGHFQDGGRSGYFQDGGPRSGYFQDGGPRASSSRPGQKFDYDGEKLNPKNRQGDLMRCFHCGSFRHLRRKCPDAKAQEVNLTEHDAEQEDDQQFAVLFTGGTKCLMSELSTEASLCAVLDSACSSTVCGVSWLKKYLSVLDETRRQYVKKDTSSHVFKFGGGEKLPSLGKYSIPATMADKDVLIVTDVVDSDIPLLLSLDSMRKADIVLHTREDKATIFGKSVNLNLTTSGHYCVSLVSDSIEVSEVMKVDLEEDMSKTRMKLLHLHRQFAHPNAEKLTQLLKGANSWKKHYAPILQEIAHSCDVCKRFQRGPARPVAALPKSTRFNQVVAMDLKKWGGQYLLYFVDEYSRLTVAKRIGRKHPKEVVEAFMELWMACGYGVPEQIMVDNGGEFTAEEILEFSSRLNIQVNTTAGHSPFSNGVCERNHAVMDVMLEKLVYENPKIPVDQLIAWACTAKNAMGMFAGYSPYQLVFGRNPTLPGFDTHPPSTNEIKGDVLLKHLTALAAARKAFTEAESSERVRRALRHKIRVAERQYVPNDQVYYKKDDSLEWFGPAKVVVQDGKVVFIRHGAYIIRVHVNRVVLVGQEYQTASPEDDVVNAPIERQGDLSNDPRADREQGRHENTTPKSVVDTATEENSALKETYSPVSWKRNAEGRLQSVQHTQMDADSKSPDILCVSRDNVVLQSKLLDTNVQWAREEELKKLKDFETFDVVDDNGQERISTRWVDTMKPDGTRKSRLVARGFEEQDPVQSDSPTISKSVLRIFMVLCAMYGWVVKTMDIKSAFLQGETLTREVFVQPPRGYETVGKLWKLRKCLYGLNDAARAFYMSVKHTLVDLKCQTSELEPAMFLYQVNGVLHGFILTHVDDFLYGGDDLFEDRVMKPLSEKYHTSRQESGTFTYVGISIVQDTDKVTLHQNDYLEGLSDDALPPLSHDSRDLNSEEYTMFRSIVGKMNWLSSGTRPDISFKTIDLSTKFAHATTTHLNDAVQTVRKLKLSATQIVYPRLSSMKDVSLTVFADASLANLENSGSCGGHLIFMTDSCGKGALVAWHSGRIKRVCRSTLAAETLAMTNALEEAVYLREILQISTGQLAMPILAITDNRSLVQAVESTSLVLEKRLRIEISVIKELVELSDVTLKWVPGRCQLADIMTKKGVPANPLLQVVTTGHMDKVP